MAIKTAREIKAGNVLTVKDEPWKVLKTEHSSSGRGNTLVNMKVVNLLTNATTQWQYKADDKLEDVILDRKEATLSFISGDAYTFMDGTDFTMYELNAEDIEGVLPFIEEGMEDICELTFYGDKLVSVELPVTVSRKVVYTENSARGDTSGKVMKPAKLSNGTEVQVADFIEIDEWIDIDTRDGSFKSRSKK